MENDKRLMQVRNSVLQSMSEGLIVIDNSGTVQYVNEMALSILNISEEELVGRKAAELFFSMQKNDEFSQKILDAVYQRGAIQTGVVPYHIGDKVRQLRVASSLLTNADGKPEGITIVLSDLSELMELKDAVKAMEKIDALNRKLDESNKLLSKTFGQFLSDEIVKELMKKPDSLEPGGKKRNLTVMMSDLRGFTAMCERMDASDLITMLNHYLRKMTDIIQRRKGTIIEFLGDGIMAVFGAPVASRKHAENAVCAALEMLSAMVEINKWNAEHNYPRLEMGIGLDSGEVIVGIIGSEKRKKYGVIGSHVNQCGRIEGYTTGGQLLISQNVRDLVHTSLEIDKVMKVFPKGLDKEMSLIHVTGIGAPYDVHVAFETNVPKPLKEPIAICFRKIEGKHVLEKSFYGGITAAGDECAFLETEAKLELFDNLQLNAGGRLLCKVMEKKDDYYLILYTSIPAGYRNWIEPYKKDA